MISVLHLANESTNYFVNSKLNRNIAGYTVHLATKSMDKSRSKPPKLQSHRQWLFLEKEPNRNTNSESAHGLKRCSLTDVTNRAGIQAKGTTPPWEVVREAEREIPT